MNKYLISSFLLILVLSGCCDKSCPLNQTIAKVNKYAITQDKFDAEFKESIYCTNDNLESRMDFLDNLIDRKLILQEAQRQGLDRDKGFLAAIERFWEQSLLKTALDKKIKEIMQSASISEGELRARYDQLVKDSMTDKTYEQMRGQLKHEILKSKATTGINEWVSDLRKNASIQINPELCIQNQQEGIIK